MILYKKILNSFHKIKGVSINLLPNKYQVAYIVESADWSISWDGKQIADSLNSSDDFHMAVRITARGIKNRIIHLGSWGTYLACGRFAKIHPSNQLILTIFHVADQIDATDARIINERVSALHTSSEITRRRLIEVGIQSEKITVIPLGVDLNSFTPVNRDQRFEIRSKLRMPDNRVIIGSFQKDGVGWGEGLEPKLIKGPDIFCQVVADLAKRHLIHVVLTGPARGYVKRELTKKQIPFTHVYLKNYYDIIPYYQALDLYLVTSRIEGGPKAILEAWATGIPVVTTPVGLVPDISHDSNDLLIAPPDDLASFIRQADRLIEGAELRERLSANGLKTVQQFNWNRIASRYYHELYQPLLKK